MQITKDLIYVGVNDHKLDLFEGQYEVPLGMAYNSYLIKDEKIAVMDSVEKGFAGEWLSNIEKALDGKAPDYLVVHHMEPDHSSSITAFMDRYPGAVMVASAKAFAFLSAFYGVSYEDRRLTASDGFELPLGRHTLRFVSAAMVHWPEVMMSYDDADKTLFSADAFGKFGANDVEDPEGWACEARRYYFGIVGKYGAQVQAVLKKLKAFEIERICPLHGPVLSEDLSYYLGIYDTWSSYAPEDRGVFIAYTSVYGHTKEAAEKLAALLEEKGCPRVSVADLARDDMFECVEDAFRHSALVLATTTYNADIFPFMKTFLQALLERGYQKRKVAFIENGTWAPQAAKVMKAMFEKSKDIVFAENTVSIMSALSESNMEQLTALSEELKEG